MRTFLALDLDEAVREALGKLPARAPAGDAKVRWVEPDKLHLTLKFLGEVPDAVLADVCAEAARQAGTVAPFTFRVCGLIASPPHGRIRMLWVGVIEESGHLAKLHRRLEEGMARLDMPAENRAFRPHVTLARIRRVRNDRALRSWAVRAGRSAAGGDVYERVDGGRPGLHAGGPGGAWRIGRNSPSVQWLKIF